MASGNLRALVQPKAKMSMPGQGQNFNAANASSKREFAPTCHGHSQIASFVSTTTTVALPAAPATTSTHLHRPSEVKCVYQLRQSTSPLLPCSIRTSKATASTHLHKSSKARCVNYHCLTQARKKVSWSLTPQLRVPPECLQVQGSATKSTHLCTDRQTLLQKFAPCTRYFCHTIEYHSNDQIPPLCPRQSACIADNTRTDFDKCESLSTLEQKIAMYSRVSRNLDQHVVDCRLRRLHLNETRPNHGVRECCCAQNAKLMLGARVSARIEPIGPSSQAL